MSTRRIGNIESSLPPQDQFLIWLRNAKKKGGFLLYWGQELEGPLIRYKWLEDVEASFRWHLVNDVNLDVLKSAQTNNDLCAFGHVALVEAYRRVFIRKLKDDVSTAICARFKRFADEIVALAAAIDELSKVFVGEDLLFTDTRQILEDQNNQISGALRLYEQIAAILGLNDSTCLDVREKSKELEQSARAHCLSHSGNRREFTSAIKKLCPEIVQS